MTTGLVIVLAGMHGGSVPVLIGGTLVGGAGFGRASSVPLGTIVPLAKPGEGRGFSRPTYVESYLAFSPAGDLCRISGAPDRLRDHRRHLRGRHRRHERGRVPGTAGDGGAARPARLMHGAVAETVPGRIPRPLQRLPDTRERRGRRRAGSGCRADGASRRRDGLGPAALRQVSGGASGHLASARPGTRIRAEACMRDFTVVWDAARLAWVRERVRAYRMPRLPTGAGWRYGCDPDVLAALCATGSTASTRPARGRAQPLPADPGPRRGSRPARGPRRR